MTASEVHMPGRLDSVGYIVAICGTVNPRSWDVRPEQVDCEACCIKLRRELRNWKEERAA